MPQHVVATPACPPQVIRADMKIASAFSQSCDVLAQTLFHEMARFLQRFSPNSRLTQSEPRSCSRRWKDVMKNDSNGRFGIIVGGVVAVIAAIFILSGGELGGKKKVEGDHDLPPITTTDK
jgi:hypothetical protein